MNSHRVAPLPLAPISSGQAASDLLAQVDARYRPACRAVLRDSPQSARLAAVRAAAGIPLEGRRQIRNAIHHVNSQGAVNTGSLRKGQTKSLFEIIQDAWCHISLWRTTLKTLEGTYGCGVLSFFVFLKSMLTLNVILAALIGVFAVLPQALSWGQYSRVLEALRASASTNASADCSLTYATNLSIALAKSTAVMKLLDTIQGTGYLENTTLFLGYYFPMEVTVGNIAYNIPVACLVVSGLAFFVSLLFMLGRTGAAFKEIIVQQASSGAAEARFSVLALSGWDYSLTSASSVGLARRILHSRLIAELELRRLLTQRVTGGAGRTCRRLGKRLLANCLVLATLGGSGYIIYRVQTLSVEFTARETSGSLLYFVYQYLPSVVLSLLSGVVPVGFTLLVRLEELTPDAAMAVTLGRCILLRLASPIMLVASIYAMVTCHEKDSCGVGSSPACPAVACWETYLGQAFYRLEVTFLAVHVAVCFLVELPRSLIGRRGRLAQLIGRPQFDIVDSVLEVLYAQVLVWFGMLFCPYLPAMNALALLTLLYLRKFSCHFCYQPPQRPLKHSSATALFMLTLLFAYFFCVIPIGYMVVALPASKSCSPFRTGVVAYESISGVVASFSRDARHLLGYLGSAGFLFVVIAVLLIVIQFYRTLALARLGIADRRLSQLAEQEQRKFAQTGQPTFRIATAFH